MLFILRFLLKVLGILGVEVERSPLGFLGIDLEGQWWNSNVFLVEGVEVSLQIRFNSHWHEEGGYGMFPEFCHLRRQDRGHFQQRGDNYGWISADDESGLQQDQFMSCASR